MDNIFKLVRKNILELKPYSSARSELKKEQGFVFLDANENPNDTEYNRYPDPFQERLKTIIAQIKKMETNQIFIGNGSDEALDLLLRVFCEPAKDNIIVPDPSYGMYQVVSQINNIKAQKCLLNNDFQLIPNDVLSMVNSKTKMIIICSPNNPTGNSINRKNILEIIKRFNGIVVVDEAYIDYSLELSLKKEINDYPNLVVLQTLSKAYGMAGLRIGIAFANPLVINLMNKIKPPYNISNYSQILASERLMNHDNVSNQINKTREERKKLKIELEKLPIVENVFPSDSNFLLVRFSESESIYQYLKDNGIVVRDRSKESLCENSLRITVGTEDQNNQLIKLLKKFSHEKEDIIYR